MGWLGGGPTGGPAAAEERRREFKELLVMLTRPVRLEDGPGSAACPSRREYHSLLRYMDNGRVS